MKYAVDILIERPRDEVISKYNNQDNLKHWMEGLQEMELLEGEQGQVGARSRILFVNGKRRMEMMETILENKLPDSMTFKFEAKGVENIVINRFEVVNEHSTRVVNDQEFKMKGFMMKLFAALMPGMFKKQSMVYLKALKAFVEDGTSVLDKN